MAGRCASDILAILASHRSIDKQAAAQLLPLIEEVDPRNKKSPLTADNDRASVAHALSQLIPRLAAQQELGLPAAKRKRLILSLAVTSYVLLDTRLEKKELLPVRALRAGCAVMPACCLH